MIWIGELSYLWLIFSIFRSTYFCPVYVTLSTPIILNFFLPLLSIHPAKYSKVCLYALFLIVFVSYTLFVILLYAILFTWPNHLFYCIDVRFLPINFVFYSVHYYIINFYWSLKSHYEVSYFILCLVVVDNVSLISVLIWGLLYFHKYLHFS